MASDPTVFVVDDDDAVRDSLDALLSAAGFSVESYGCARDFLDRLSSEREGVLLLDVRMPDINGIEVQRRLARNSNLSVIIITGHGDVPLAVEAMKAGAVDFIEKPFTEATILGSVRLALEGLRKASSQASEAAGIAKRADSLTPREREVLEHLVVGRQNKVIAYELGISPRTVEIHRARVMEKMQAESLSHLVRMALQAGIEPPPR